MGRLLRIGLIVIGVIAVVVVGIILLALGLTQPVVDAGDTFFTAVKEGRSDDAYAMFATSLREEVSEEQFRGLFDGVEVGSWSYSNRQVRNNIGNLEGTAVFDGEEYNISLVFDNVDGKWLLIGYNFRVRG